MTGTELLRALGRKIDDERSILRAASDAGVPIFCPALSDSMIGLQAWLFRQTHPLNVDAFGDVGGLVDICYGASRSGIVIIGGGAPKNFALQAMLVTPNSFDLAIQLTTDRPEPGALGSVPLRGRILGEDLPRGEDGHGLRRRHHQPTPDGGLRPDPAFEEGLIGGSIGSRM